MHSLGPQKIPLPTTEAPGFKGGSLSSSRINKVTNNDLIVVRTASFTALLNGLAKVLPGIAILGFLAFLSLLSIWSLIPPKIATNVPPTEFSSARAKDYLKAIAANPHPIGSPAHAGVRDYIFSELVKMGLQPQLQK